MNKLILIAIIAVIILVFFVFLFIFLSSGNTDSNSQNQTTNTEPGTVRTFEVRGVKVEVLKEGKGAEVKDGDSVTVHYVGTLADGTQFDSSVDIKRPYTFTLGKHSVKEGFEIGVLGMKVGEKRKLTIPPELAYGKDGFITIPPDATLTFEVELLKINN